MSVWLVTQAGVNAGKCQSEKKGIKVGSSILEPTIILKTPVKVRFDSPFEIQQLGPARLVDMGSWLSCG